MRRQVFHLAAAAVLAAALSACAGQGGYGFNTSGSNGNSIDHIVFTNGSGQVNVFAVAPTGPPGGPGAPGPLIQVNGIGTRGTQGVIVPDSTFAWTAAFTLGEAFYQSSQNGTLKPCSVAVPTSGTVLPDISPFSTTPVIFFQVPGGVSSFAPIAPGQQSATVFVTPAQGVTFGSGKTNYCMTLTAFGSGTNASVQIAVTNSL
jgi:hypothetical protein